MRPDFRQRAWRGALPFASLLPALATNCSSDHAELAARPHAAGAAGRAGAAGAGGMGRGGALARGGNGGALVTPPDKHVEPPGRSVLTVVHGVVDADRLAWCFARVRDGKTELVGTPVPEAGLAFGESASFESLPHVNSETDGVVPYVITGDLSLIAGLDCAAAVALAAGYRATALALDGLAGAGNANGGEGGASGGGAGASSAGEAGAPSGGVSASAGADNGGEIGAAGAPPVVAPALRVGALPALPAGSLAEGYSLLEVADGCLGAPGFTAPHVEDICGAGYSPNTGTLTGELVILSRATAEGMLALQALHASRGGPSLGVSANPPADAVESSITLVDDFSEGALRPVDPRRDQPATAYGVSQRSWNVVASHNGAYEFGEPWLGISKRSGVSPEDGRGYTLIVIGASYTAPQGDWWHSMAFTLVDNDPGGP